MFTSKQLVDWCKRVKAAGWVYWYGTVGYKCTESLYNSKKRQYPSHYTSDRTAGYKKDIAEGRWCADCVGLIKSFFWKNNDLTAKDKYASNGCPDVSANGMIALCPKTGPISSMPDIPGLVVWKSGHIGVYIGGGYTIEMRGFAYDCVQRRVKDGPWTKWGRLPASMISYDESAPDVPAEPEGLRWGDTGVKVRELQEDLLALGYALPEYGADGDFGSETQAAVRAFQRDSGLPDTGIADARTLAAIESALEDGQATQPPTKAVKIIGGTVNVRSAPGTAYQILGVAKRGDKLPYQDEEHMVDGRPWYLVEFKGQNGWVSSKYSEVVDV